MENTVTNHIVQQEAQPEKQQFVVPMQDPKFVVNTVNLDHTNDVKVKNAVGTGSHKVNHDLNHETSAQVKGNTSAMQGAAKQHGQVTSTARVSELAREVDPNLQLDEEVEEILETLAQDFADKVINGATKLAKHRHVPAVEVKDVQLYLERNFDMRIPGFGTDELRPYKQASLTEAHKQRQALIRRALKKN